MDFLRVGEALLRSSQPLLPFLAPSACRPRTVGLTSKSAKRASLPAPSRRAFSASSPYQIQETQVLAAGEDADQQSRPSRANASPDIGALLDSVLNRDKGSPAAPTGRTSRFKSPSAQQANSPLRLETRQQQRASDGPQQGAGGAIDELLNMFPKAASPPLPTSSKRPLDARTVLGFHQNPPPPSAPEPAPMKLDSSLGRTIQVDTLRNMDVARAFRTLEIQCARNSVRRDSMRQRFHERPGLKRKRLKSERWRRRFRENFKGTVAMVQKMKAQGW